MRVIIILLIKSWAPGLILLPRQSQ